MKTPAPWPILLLWWLSIFSIYWFVPCVPHTTAVNLSAVVSIFAYEWGLKLWAWLLYLCCWSRLRCWNLVDSIHDIDWWHLSALLQAWTVAHPSTMEWSWQMLAAEWSCFDKDGATALHFAAKSGSAPVVELLLRQQVCLRRLGEPDLVWTPDFSPRRES